MRPREHLPKPSRAPGAAASAGEQHSTSPICVPYLLSDLLKDAMRRRAARALLAGVARASEAGSKPLSMEEIHSEVRASSKRSGGSSVRSGNSSLR